MTGCQIFWWILDDKNHRIHHPPSVDGTVDETKFDKRPPYVLTNDEKGKMICCCYNDQTFSKKKYEKQNKTTHNNNIVFEV